ncbi:MAG: phospho-sugar mutase [Thermoguttaceae bacterium]|nr:phospho-sugar mutase [Thermoguttaceae bacterium]
MNATKQNEALNAVKQAREAGKITAESEMNITRWLTESQFEAYFDTLVDYISQGAWKELDDAFWTIIPFGTGGRRGKMFPVGCNVINDRTIGESAQGTATYVKNFVGSDHQPSCAIAYDTRHRSREFAELCASIMAANGFKVWFLDGYRSTPEMSFMVRYKGCDCGIMVTASHNPPSDNAVKVYWSTGGQLLPPHDKGVIDCVMATEQILIANFQEELEKGTIEYCQEEVDKAFIDAVLKQSHPGPRDIKILYSPLHGVGATCVLPALAGAGFDNVELYGPTANPDPNFTNVPNHVSNPENAVVFDAMIEYAKQNDFDLIMATDPDSDRMGCAAPLKINDKTGKWSILTGNQIGALFAEYQLEQACNYGDTAMVASASYYIVKTLVTTDLIRKITESYGATLIGDLMVGFKYIGGAMDDHGTNGFLLGTEESYGYLIGDHARDKDAAVASMVFAELTAKAKAEGLSIHEKLAAIFRRYGVHQERTISVMAPGAEGMEKIKQVMAGFRTAPPATVAGMQIACVKDYLNQTTKTGDEIKPLVGPKGDLVIIELEKPGNYVAVRPSGTEPKIKFYMFTCLPPQESQDVDAGVAVLQSRLNAMESDLRAVIE